MGAQILGTVILWLIVAAILVVIAVYLLRWLYRRSTKETAFVRTGFGGERVVINGGAFVVPVLHEVSPVNMNVMRIEVRRGQTNALITRDRMRIDLIAEFFLRVSPTHVAVALASQTLGRRAMMPDGIRDLFEGKFASSLRAIAAEMSLQDIHEKRSLFMTKVRDLAGEALAFNGLELETVSLVDLDQTRLEHFDPSNAFDAEGLTQLTEIIETRRKMRNQIEQDTMLAIRNQNLDAERRSLEIERDSEYARLEQEREVEVRRAVQRTTLVRERALREHEAQKAEIESSEATERARIAQERSLAEVRTAKDEQIQQREITRRRAIEAAELESREATERDEITRGLAVERERINRLRAQEELEVGRRQAIEMAEREREIVMAGKAIEVVQKEGERRKAEIASEEIVEQARVARDRSLDEARLARERQLEALQVEKRKLFETAEIAARLDIERARIETDQNVERAEIAAQLRLELDRIGQRQEQEALEVLRRRTIVLAERESDITLSRKSVEVIQAEIEARRAEILQRTEVERERMVGERKIDEARVERERALQGLEIAKRQAFEEAEIASGEEIERSRIATERGLGEARVIRDRDLRKLEIEKERTLEVAEIEKTIEVSGRVKARSVAIADAEQARKTAVLAEEETFTIREREIAERRRTVDMIAARRDAEREGLRLTAKAEAERDAALSLADAQRTAAKADADAMMIRNGAQAERFKVDAEGTRAANEADNVLTVEARASRARLKLLDKIEGIVRESVKPMEKIDGINILHVDGLNGGGGGRKNVTDEVIDSALRYRVQAPMIDSLMKEVGIEGGSIGRMTDVLRDAKDIDSIVRNRQKAPGPNGAAPHPADHDDDRDH